MNSRNDNICHQWTCYYNGNETSFSHIVPFFFIPAPSHHFVKWLLVKAGCTIETCELYISALSLAFLRRVICRQLGQKVTGMLTPQDQATVAVPAGVPQVGLYDLRCTGAETTVQECTGARDASRTSWCHSELTITAPGCESDRGECWWGFTWSLVWAVSTMLSHVIWCWLFNYFWQFNYYFLNQLQK
jgi:hypothetical protein